MTVSARDRIARKMVEASAARIKAADAAEERSLSAYRAGNFEDYWMSMGKEAEERIEAEYEHSDGGSSGENGGSKPDNDVSEANRDRSSTPPAEELPQTA